MNEQVKIFTDIDELNEFAAAKFVGIAQDSIARQGNFSVALAGGSTPKALYRLLAGEKFGIKIDWEKVNFYFGDERNVPPDDLESNFLMADENLFRPLRIEPKNVFRWQTELPDAEIIAEEYEKQVRLIPAGETGLPRFDLILLGMGADGHTASLFPFTEALHETTRLASANSVEKLSTTRLTLTFPVINNARNVIFLVAGAEKAETLKAVLEGADEPAKFPSQMVKPHRGNLFWLVDEKAASLLA